MQAKTTMVRLAVAAWQKLRKMAFDDMLPMGALLAYLIEAEWERRKLDGTP